jgi:hypothetical protein
MTYAITDLHCKLLAHTLQASLSEEERHIAHVERLKILSDSMHGKVSLTFWQMIFLATA